MIDTTEWAFSHEFQMTLHEYARFEGVFSLRTRWPRRVLLLAAAVAMLFWSYTLLLGIIVLGLFLVAATMKVLIPGTRAHRFARSKHLHSEIRYSVTADGLRAESVHFRIWSAWTNLCVWRVTGPWLVLQGYGVPAFYFRIAELRTAGVWDEVDRLMRRHGVEYGSKESNRL